MGPFVWLVGNTIMKAEWRSASVECGGQYYKDAFVVCRQLGYPATGEDDEIPLTFIGLHTAGKQLYALNNFQ